MRTELEPITGDNRRPGMNPDHKFLVRYNSHPRFGWLCAHTFLTEKEALDFQQLKKDEAEYGE